MQQQIKKGKTNKKYIQACCGGRMQEQIRNKQKWNKQYIYKEKDGLRKKNATVD